MEPQLPRPQFNPEVDPTQHPVRKGGETFSITGAPEASAPLEQGRETRERMMDGPKGDPGASQPVFTPPSLPVIDQTQTSDSTASQSSGSAPVAAADEDLIEKEWVEKAKKVVAETRNDPHAQDIAIGKLQADYLKKRYGKIIALPKEE